MKFQTSSTKTHRERQAVRNITDNSEHRREPTEWVAEKERTCVDAKPLPKKKKKDLVSKKGELEPDRPRGQGGKSKNPRPRRAERGGQVRETETMPRDSSREKRKEPN